MVIEKICTGEIIQYETTENPMAIIKRHLGLNRSFKKEKELNLNENRISGKFVQNSQVAFERLVTENGYTYIK